MSRGRHSRFLPLTIGCPLSDSSERRRSSHHLINLLFVSIEKLTQLLLLAFNKVQRLIDGGLDGLSREE